MRKTVKNLAKYLIEFIIVAFGVFLGIYASDWQGQKKVNKEKAKTAKYILDELETNKANLEKTIAYHEQIRLSFDSLSATLSQEDLLATYFNNPAFHHQNIEGWKGMSLPNFEDIAFEGAKISGILQEMDIEAIQTISKAYKYQDFINEIGKSALDRMINLDSSSKLIDMLRILELLTSDFLNSEQQLLRQYNVTIDKIKNEISQ